MLVCQDMALVHCSENLQFDHLKSGRFEDHNLNGLGFKGLCYSYIDGYDSNHLKPDLSKSEHFWTDFKWCLTKWQSFVQVSNCQTSVYQIPFFILTFAIQPLFEHLRSGRVWILDPHCTKIVMKSLDNEQSNIGLSQNCLCPSFGSPLLQDHCVWSCHVHNTPL